MSQTPHPEDCQCHLHISVHCDYCSWKGIGTTRLGRHIQTKHPDEWTPRKIPSARRLAAKMLQAHEVAKEMKRLGQRGVRFLPKSKLDRTTVDMVNAWIRRMTDSDKVSENLLVSGLLNSEQGISSIREFKALAASIKEAMKLGDDKLPALWVRNTHFNPQVAGEILKLAFALNKSWSFTVHLLILYGLNALAEELSTTGAQPPTWIASPNSKITTAQKQMNRNETQRERDEAFIARNPAFDTQNRPIPYIIRDREGEPLDV